MKYLFEVTFAWGNNRCQWDCKPFNAETPHEVCTKVSELLHGDEDAKSSERVSVEVNGAYFRTVFYFEYNVDSCANTMIDEEEKMLKKLRSELEVFFAKGRKTEE